MKLSTYNFLTSKAIKGVKVGYPLKLTVIITTTQHTSMFSLTDHIVFPHIHFQIAKKDVVETEFNPTFIERLLPKLDWNTVYMAAQTVGNHHHHVYLGLPQFISNISRWS